MKSIHLVIPDLLLPADVAAEACAGLHLPALERMLTRGASTGSARTVRGASTGAGPSTGSGRADEGESLEGCLCDVFGVPRHAGVPVAPISALFDGLAEGCWLRADPVHLQLRRDQLVLLPDLGLDADEAKRLCASLNEHFAGQGVAFFAPHPQRWYVRVERLPQIDTIPLSQAIGHNVHGLLPTGREALRWHQLFNEAQMLLFSHPVNQAREARGALTANSLWFWGGGCTADARPQKTFDHVTSDEPLGEMFASAVGIPFSGWPGQWREEEAGGRQLLVSTGLRSALERGDLGAWRLALQDFEKGYAQPLWQALRAGRIGYLQMDVSGRAGMLRLSLKRADAWAFWRRSAGCLADGVESFHARG